MDRCLPLPPSILDPQHMGIYMLYIVLYNPGYIQSIIFVTPLFIRSYVPSASLFPPLSLSQGIPIIGRVRRDYSLPLHHLYSYYPLQILLLE